MSYMPLKYWTGNGQMQGHFLNLMICSLELLGSFTVSHPKSLNLFQKHIRITVGDRLAESGEGVKWGINLESLCSQIKRWSKCIKIRMFPSPANSHICFNFIQIELHEAIKDSLFLKCCQSTSLTSPK